MSWNLNGVSSKCCVFTKGCDRTTSSRTLNRNFEIGWKLLSTVGLKRLKQPQRNAKQPPRKRTANRKQTLETQRNIIKTHYTTTSDVVMISCHFVSFLMYHPHGNPTVWFPFGCSGGWAICTYGGQDCCFPMPFGHIPPALFQTRAIFFFIPVWELNTHFNVYKDEGYGKLENASAQRLNNK